MPTHSDNCVLDHLSFDDILLKSKEAIMEKEKIPVVQLSDFRPVPRSAWQMFKDRIRQIFCPRKVVQREKAAKILD